MSDTPNIVTGDSEAPTIEPPQETTPAPATASEQRREIHDVWVAGTEEPQVAQSTNEGAQELLPAADEPALAIQAGTVVEDDYLFGYDSDLEERQIINMGPQHPSTHGVLRMQLELEGETIRRVKPIIGYLHTGMEKTAETLTWLQGPTNVTRMDYLSPFFNELAFSMAVEDLLGIEIPPRGQAIRILMTELNRVSSHLVWLSTQGMDIGALSLMLYGWRERELFLALFEKTTGLRMNHNFIRPGGVAADLPDGWEDDIAEILAVMPNAMAEYDELIAENPIFLDRTQGVGVLTADECRAYGVTGPVARASGIPVDVRKIFPYSGIEQYDFDVPVGKTGDTYDRYLVRMEEMRQSLGIVAQLLETMPGGDYRSEDRKVTPPPRKRIDESMEALIHHFKIFTEGFQVPAGEAYASVESPRGELGCFIASDGGPKPYRMRIRPPSYINLQTLPHLMHGRLIADAVAIISSVDPIMGEVDR